MKVNDGIATYDENEPCFRCRKRVIAICSLKFYLESGFYKKEVLVVAPCEEQDTWEKTMNTGKD